MTPRNPKGTTDQRRDALKEQLGALLAEIRRQLGDAEAKAALFECAAEAFPAAPEAGASSGASARAALRHEYRRIVGRSPAIVSVLRTLDRLSDSDLPVLITGESGTGKELVARAIHENGNRAGRVFVRENCAAIPESLLESELFGYRRGAFTGAVQDKKGLFEEADGGSVFLDEIGEMSLNMQAKLMRVLQEGEIRPVGAPASIHVDVRLISATNQDLKRLVTQGRFREDLYFRLNVVPIEMPTLRDRPDDIPLLVETFLRTVAERAGRPPKQLEPAALELLVRYQWPGNVRELENEIARAFALSGPTIRVADLSPEAAGRQRSPA